MDLRSTQKQASWHPFTGLIEYEGAWAERAFYGIPFVSDPPMVDGRSVVTTIHHELTHHACARTTRLGFAFSAEAARLLRLFRQGGDLTLTTAAIMLLGVYLPILEGLALYAELDADEQPGDIIIPNPVPLHAQMMELTWHRKAGDVLRIARDEQIYETPEQKDGLLRLVFADIDAPETSYYLVGYLWVKAAVALIARINPRLGRPTVVLPLLIKLLCDHPLITEIWQGNAGEQEIAAGLLESILSLDQPALARVEDALTDQESLSLFELWDLHGFLEDRNIKKPLMDEESIIPFLGDEADELEMQARCAASIHFPSRTTGILVGLQANENDLLLEMETDSGEQVQASLPSVASVWFLFGQLPHYRPLIEKHGHVAAHLEASIRALMAEWRGQRITIASYWALSQPPLPGIAIWHEDGRMVELPYEPHWFEFKHHIQLTQNGLHISIDEKLRFAKSLRSASSITSIGRRSTETLLSHLVSNDRARMQIVQKRLVDILGPTGREALETWVAVPLFRPALWQLGEAATAELNKIFDMPAFPPLQPDFDFKALLPVLEQPEPR